MVSICMKYVAFADVTDNYFSVFIVSKVFYSVLNVFLLVLRT